jgi:carboxymethylenebutenolidase
MTVMPDITLPYFLAQPAGTGPWPGVVVVQEANGISPQLLRLSQRLAAEGFMTLAPDLFFRLGGTEAAEYTELVPQLKPEETKGDLAACAQILRDLGAPKVGITGFCMGGGLSYRMAVQTTAFDAAVGFYGSSIAADLGTPNCPTLLFFGAKDPWIPTADIEKVAAHHADTIVYPNAGHGFMRDRSDDYAEADAPDAWERLLKWFRAEL